MMEIAVPKIHQVRIDVPLRTACAYFFISRRDAATSHPWWEGLYEYLLSFSSRELRWEFAPEQGGYFTWPPLADADRNAIVARLRTAPPSVVAGHRTLRRAVALSPEEERRLELMYFCGEGEVLASG
jgi:hypothetical protein